MECNVSAVVGQVEVQATRASSQVSRICIAEGYFDWDNLGEIFRIDKKCEGICEEKTSKGVSDSAFAS